MDSFVSQPGVLQDHGCRSKFEIQLTLWKVLFGPLQLDMGSTSEGSPEVLQAERVSIC